MKTLLKFTCLVISLLLLFTAAGCGNAVEPEVYTEASLVADAKLSESRYTLGTKMGDYTVTDVNGVSHKFSDLLKEKDAIILNFWFTNCGPCRMEFPYMEEAYQNYKEDIEILAINPTGESASEIKAFAEEMGLSFPVAEGEEYWAFAMALVGYPTTVVIDRTGTVSMIHVGYIDSTETFERIFEFFTDEDYTPTLVNDISEFK